MTGSRDRVQDALDRSVAELGVVGIVAHVQDESGTWFGAAGVADRETGRRREPVDRFLIGSGGKAYTSAAVLQLAAEGRLSLDDTVEKWLPGVVSGNGNDGSKITVRHLIGHTSGLWVTGFDADMVRALHTRAGFAEHRHYVWTVEKLLELQMSQPPIFAPGESFAYTNGGYHLAGAIIEKATGNAYEEEVERTVIRPLGLTGTYARPLAEPGIRGPHARAYSRMFIRDDVDPSILNTANYESYLQGPETDPVDVTDATSFGWAAGNVVSTTGDMLRFTSAMISGTLLPPAQHREMWTTVPTRDWIPNTRYGTGVSEWTLADGGTLHAVVGMQTGSASFTLGAPGGTRLVSVNLNCDWNWAPALDLVIEAAFGSPFFAQP
ncbi:serine hydrolase [Spongiactinospora rosea]|uniref:Serine hydrolase n=1 Tax=Spongiactinospora rosea TaxID=2248750 RepID=A0A366LLU9_9ACTN|nr:serine hydrolase domain-containing protein [Spongiactinospora rosea]RBQ14132.1 serine hydrolase [Spongiactinospora rosea]